MKKLFVIFLILFLSSTVWADENYFIQDGIKWGMNQSEVLTVEKHPLVEQADWYLHYDLGPSTEYDKSEVFYCFTSKDNLGGIFYIFSTAYENDVDYLAVWENLKAIISNEYSPAKYERERWGPWVDEKQVSSRIERLKGIQDGALILYTPWQTPTMHVTLCVSNEDNLVRQDVTYQSREFLSLFGTEFSFKHLDGDPMAQYILGPR